MSNYPVGFSRMEIPYPLSDHHLLVGVRCRRDTARRRPGEGAKMEEIQHTDLEWSRSRPTVVTRHPTANQRSRGAEALIRVALCALSALLVSLIWIFGSPAGADAKAWSLVIGLSTTAAMSLYAGLTRAEADKLRADLADSEARTMAAIESAVATINTEIHLHTDDARPAGVTRAGPQGLPARGRRRSRGARRQAVDPGQLITDEFRLFMQGRESLKDDGQEPW